MEQVLYKLPDGWRYESLGKLTHIVGGATPAKNQATYWGGQIKWASVRDLHSEELLDTEFKITEEGLKNSSTNIIPPETVVISTRVGLGKVVITKDSVAINQDLKGLLIKGDIEVRYLFYWLKSQAEYIKSVGTGATVKGVKLDFIKNLSCPLPKPNEQKRIVEKLDALLIRIDTAIAHLQESVTLADALYASELNEIFPSDADIESLSDIDSWVSLSDICTFENGDRGKNYPSKSAFVAEGIPVVSAGNLGERYIEHKGLNYITPERYDLLRSGRIKIGDILFCLRGSLGKVAISKDIDEGVIASSLVIIRPKECVSAEYIYKYLKSSLCQQFISFYNNGAAQPNLSAKSLGKFMLPLPSAAEQKIIVHGLDEKYQLNQKLLEALRNKIISLQSLKASILDSAFKGEL